MLLVPSGTTAAPAVHITWPPSSILKFPPANLPSVLTPPVADGTFARPFSISPELYNNLLSVNYPITIAIVYATSVFLLNRINAQRDHKPWSFSKTSAFFAFVIAHNVFLAIYSAWTFVGMINAIKNSWPSWHDDHGVAGVVDALCKINGPRGLGSAATYNSTTSSWGVTNELIKLVGGTPDNTDVGRIWNEGLAYYGWLFYVSKFYEVLDTMIILAKGKKSSFLQTYHHAGAMMCMWAGMRYMSPPIWMFVLINSFIHALMVSSALCTQYMSSTDHYCSTPTTPLPPSVCKHQCFSNGLLQACKSPNLFLEPRTLLRTSSYLIPLRSTRPIFLPTVSRPRFRP